MTLLTLENINKPNKANHDTTFFHQTVVDGRATTKIRLLPDPNGVIAVKIRRNSIRNNENAQFYTGFSPATIKLPDPIAETWLELYRANDPRYRQFVSSERYICNVLIVKNPNNPSLEGEVRLFEFNKTLWSSIARVVKPSEEDIEMGTKPIPLFSLDNGVDFIISRKMKGDFPTFEDSGPQGDTYSIESLSFVDGIEEVKSKAFDLSKLLEPSSFDTYEHIKQRLFEITNGQFWGAGEKPTSSNTTSSEPDKPTEPEPETKAVEPPKKSRKTEKAEAKFENVDDLDALLDSI